MRYKVDSVADFLKLIETEGLKDYIYRGQNEPYFGIKASAFRPYQGIWFKDKFFDIEQLQRDYYQRVIMRISDEEKKHFLAFCQHHGLPTNVVDFTYSPLVAMFFSCHGKKAPVFTIEELIDLDTFSSIEILKTDESIKNKLIQNLVNKLSKNYNIDHSEIYMIQKERLVDITDIVIKYHNKNLFELIENNSEVQIDISHKIEKMFRKNKNLMSRWISNIVDVYRKNKGNLYKLNVEIDYIIDSSNYDFENKLFELTRGLDCIEDKTQIIELYTYLMNEIEDENITHGDMYFLSEHEIDFTPVVSLAAKIYMALLINLIQKGRELKEVTIIDLDIYFVYQPPNLFERISSQKGIFIYQPYLYFNDDIYDFSYLSTQCITPDIIVEVHNYRKVLQELSYLGINTDSIYSDLDNIAKAVVFEHEQILYKVK